MPTIRDIAAVAKVNPSTVSKALRGSTDLNAGTAERIRKLAAEMGYNMDHLHTEFPDTKTIGVVFPEFRSEYYCNIFDTFRHAMESKGYRVITMVTGFDSPEEQEKSISYLINRRVGGILYLTENKFDVSRLRTRIISSGISFVMITLMGGIDFCDIISVNHALGVRIAMEHLYRQGHRKIAFLGESNTEGRREAFCRLARDFALPIPQEYIVIQQERYCEGGYRGMKHLLRLPEEICPTAVFAAYDHLAYGAIRAIEEAGLSVPKDFSIIGVDNNQVSGYLSTPLTSIEMPVEEVGKSAALMLQERMSGDCSPFQTTLFSPRICVRKSTAPLTSETVADHASRVINAWEDQKINEEIRI